MELVASAQRVMGPDEVFSHLTAARLLRLPVPEPWSPNEPIHVTGMTSAPRRRRNGIVAHRGLESRDVELPGDVRCTDRLSTWADLASTLDVDDLVVLGDAVVHRLRGIPVRAVEETVSGRPHHRGIARLRQAAPLVRSGSDSAMETRARLLFVRGGLPEPELNMLVDDEAGEWLGTGDLVWRAKRVVAEFDGDYHRTVRRRWQVDVGRRESIQDHGWHYVQLTAKSITVPHLAARTLARVARLLDVRLPG